MHFIFYNFSKINSSLLHNINNLRIIFDLVVLVTLFTFYYGQSTFALGTDMDVKCTVYDHSDDINGNNVDVRILVMGLKENHEYTANVLPDHNSPTKVTTKSDLDGTFWVIAKVPNGEKSTLFNVNVYEGNSTNGKLAASGDDDAPCYNIPFRPSNSSVNSSK